MTNFTYSILDQNSYNLLRFNTLKEVEENNDLKEQAYLDSKGIPTIGLGMNLRDANVRSAVVDEIVKNYQGLITEAEKEQIKSEIATVANKTFSSVSQLQSELNAVMAKYAEAGATFSFVNETQIKTVFDIIVQKYETRVNNWLSDIPNSTERSVLLSLSYNGILNESVSLKSAIQSNNRAEAWYQIRYVSNGDQLDGIAKRRYYESEKFGLYKNAGNPTEKEAKDAYKMFTKHKSDITAYDNKYDDQLDKDYNNGFAQDLTESLAPAKSYLVNKYANGKEIDNILIGDFGDQSTSDSLTGTNKNDLILGEDGNDVLKAGDGDDVIIGGEGNDTLDGGEGSDTYIFYDNYGFDTIIDSDQKGSIIVNVGSASFVLSGTAKAESDKTSNSVTPIYKLASNGKTYDLTLSGGDLFIREENDLSNGIVIKGFKNGSFGITLDEDTNSDKISDWINSALQSFANAVLSAVRPKDPLIIDTNNNGLKLSSWQSSGVKFDMDANGTSESTGWTTPSNSNYQYNKGTGAIIIDAANANLIDRIVFGSGISKDDLTFSQVGVFDSSVSGTNYHSDLVITFKNSSNDKITILNYFRSPIYEWNNGL